MIGVNVSGNDAKKLKEVMDKEQLNWRSFAETRGEGGMGAISTAWNLQGTPTLFVLDQPIALPPPRHPEVEEMGRMLSILGNDRQLNSVPSRPLAESTNSE